MTDAKEAARSRTAIGEPIEVNATTGKKIYMVQGNKFEIDKRYSLIKVVGYGAYGTVVSATDDIAKDKVAIKRMCKVFEDLVDGKRILRELKVLSALKHENVLSIRHLPRPSNFEKFDDVYVVTELMDADLHMIIRSSNKLSDDHCQYFVGQAFRGLNYIHSANIMHRDLKPSNLLVKANCDLVICDFGLARGYEPSVLTEYVVTRWYRPPELLLLSTRYTKAIDVWSMGLIFAELLNRKTLFAGKDYINQLSLVTDVLGSPSTEDMENMSMEAKRYMASLPPKKAVPFTSLFPTATAPAIDLLSKLLVFDPEKRLTSLEALRHPYLARLYTPESEKTATQQFSWELDNVELTEPQLRAGISEEMRRERVVPGPPAPPATATAPQ